MWFRPAMSGNLMWLRLETPRREGVIGRRRVAAVCGEGGL
jgi:hypothetical protein